jgi:cell division inhibitor SepF
MRLGDREEQAGREQVEGNWGWGAPELGEAWVDGRAPVSALQKLKAYFGMVPADELDEYEDERYGGYAPSYAGSDEFESYADRSGGRRRLLDNARPVSRLEAVDDYADGQSGRRPWAPADSGSSRTVTPTRGALAVEPEVEPAPRPRPQQEHHTGPLSRITTVHPRSYLEARTIGERYRDGNPVIMNLTDMDDADAKRLVDFAAGLVFAMRGDMDKVTNRVFLISPPNVDVTAEDRRRIAEGGLFS